MGSMKILNSITKELERQNKLVKKLDKSPAGWKSVEEYLSDSLASYSEEERKIKVAETKALEKQQVVRTYAHQKPSLITNTSSNTNHRFWNAQLSYWVNHGL